MASHLQTKEEFSRLRMLKCFGELVSRLKSGQSTYQIAKWVQDEKGEGLDVAVGSLRAQIAAFRREMKALVLLEARQPAFVQEAMDKVNKGLNELDELQSIYELQKQRIVAMHELETKLGISNRMTGNEVRIAAELLRTRHQIKMDLGVDGGPNLGTLTIQPGVRPQDRYAVRDRYGSEIESVIDVPEKRQRVLDTVRRALALTELKERPDVIDGESGGRRAT
jgi:hypothetical protein